MANILSFHKKQKDNFDQLLLPHIDHLYRIAYRLCSQQSLAEDLVQELLVRLYPRMNELNEVRELRPWLIRSLNNLYIDYFRRAERNPVQGGEEQMQIALESEQDNSSNEPVESVEQDQLQNRLIQALDKLNDDQRQLIIFYDVEGYSLPELSEILDTPVGTLKSRVHRAHVKLRELLSMGTF